MLRISDGYFLPNLAYPLLDGLAIDKRQDSVRW